MRRRDGPNRSTLGGGLVHEGTAIAVIGTYGATYVVSEESQRDPNGTLICKNNSGPENYTVEAASIASASCYRWFRTRSAPSRWRWRRSSAPSATPTA